MSAELKQSKVGNIVRVEIPSVKQIIAYNVQKDRALIRTDGDNPPAGQRSTYPAQAMAFKINSKIVFSDGDGELMIFVRPATEYSLHDMWESSRSNGSTSIKCALHLCDKQLHILAFLMTKHLLLLNYRNRDTFDYFISHADVNTTATTVFHFDSNSTPPSHFQQRFYEFKQQFIARIQQFLTDCETRAKYLRNANMEVQKEIFNMSRQNGYEMNGILRSYFIFIRYQIEKQINSFHEKCVEVLSHLDGMKPTFTVQPTGANITAELDEWKLRLFKVNEKFDSVRSVFESFQSTVMSHHGVQLETFLFENKDGHQKSVDDDLYYQVKDIVQKNLLRRTTDGSHPQTLHEYIYGPYIGVLNKCKSNIAPGRPSSRHLGANPPGLSPKMYFIKRSLHLKRLKESREAVRIDGETNSVEDSAVVSTLSEAIAKLNGQIFGPNFYNRFDLIVRPDDRQYLLSLNSSELTTKLAEYITVYTAEFVASRERLRYFDFVLSPISIYLGVASTHDTFDPFVHIGCDVHRRTRLPQDIQVTLHEQSTPTNESINSHDDLPVGDEKSTSNGARPKESVNHKKNSQRTSSAVNLNGDSVQCCICFENFRKISKCFLKCQHVFHKECIDVWRQNSATCPMCRTPIEYDEFPPL